MAVATTGNDKFTALLPSMPGIVTAGGIAVIFIIIACMLPGKQKNTTIL